MQKILITGVSGGQGQLVAHLAARDHEVVGVDRTPPGSREPGTATRNYIVDLTRRKFEDVVRSERPDAVIHLAFVRHFRTDLATRHRINLTGTRQLLDYCVDYGVRQLVVVSSAYAYGALAENPGYMHEDSALNVSRNYAELRDLAEVDALCSAFLWQHPEVRTAILRPVNTLGDSVHSAIGGYLRQEWVPTLLGFDPMMQFLHEEDLARAILLAVERRLRGIFNVAGPGAVPLHVAIEETGALGIPIPEIVLRPLVERLFQFGLYPVPPGAIDFIKFPCTVNDRRFRDAAGYRPNWSLQSIFRRLREERGTAPS